jgi:hypothetical protein
MIYIFSSAYYELFKQNVLNASCYPDGQVMRLRYDAKYVHQSIRNQPSLINGKGALLVFAEGAIENSAAKDTAGKPLRDYRFFPIRRCTISAADKKADIFILDVKLNGFLDYQDGPQARDSIWDEHIKKSPDRPWPKNLRQSDPAEGFYVFSGDDLPSVSDERGVEVAWRSLVERLNSSELRDCITFRVLGFYRFGLGSKERSILPEVTGADAIYRFRSAETVVLKILLYGDANRKGATKTLKLEFDPKAFTSASVPALLVNSHYDEERILLPCARTTDPVITSVGLIQADPKTGVWSPQPTFVVEVAPRGSYLFLVVVLFALSFLLINLGKFSDLWTTINWRDAGSVLDHLAKPIGGVLFLVASWLYLRKFPLK